MSFFGGYVEGRGSTLIPPLRSRRASATSSTRLSCPCKRRLASKSSGVIFARLISRSSISPLRTSTRGIESEKITQKSVDRIEHGAWNRFAASRSVFPQGPSGGVKGPPARCSESVAVVLRPPRDPVRVKAMNRTQGSASRFPRTAFVIAWCFLAIAAGWGAILRVQVIYPLIPLEYAHMLHAHSHAAFLGWVFNAFVALALRFFVPEEKTVEFRNVFWVMQIAVVGMLLTFPFQGYAAASITFSTLHLAGGATFAWKLLRQNVVTTAARWALRWAIVFLVLSAAGPLALGPMAASGMKGTPWYQFAIYFYLHFQYNGWFIFFLLAAMIQRQQERASAFATAPLIRAIHWLAVGCLLTVVLSAWWMGPTPWMFLVATLGGGAQLVGLLGLFRTRLHVGLFASPIASTLGTLAFCAFALKLALQLASGIPAFADLAMARPVVIGFLHLVFLGVVTPLLIAWAAELAWLRIKRLATAGLSLLLVGAAATELVLFAQPLPSLVMAFGGWLNRPEILAGSALTMAVGTLLLGTGLTAPTPARKT